VILDVPAAIPVTTPVVAFTVATEVLELVHAVTPGVPLPVNVIVPPTQAEVLPLTVGRGLTVTMISV